MCGKGYIFVDIKMSVYIHLFFVLRSLLNKNYKCYEFVGKYIFFKGVSFCLNWILAISRKSFPIYARFLFILIVLY